MKKILLISAVCLGLLNIPQAYADFEAVENTLTQLEKLQKKAQVLQQKYQKIQSAYNAARQGDFGALKTVSSDLGFDKVDVKMPKVLADKVQNKGELEKAIEKDTLPNYEHKDQVAIHLAAKKLNEDMMREDLARMYAYAFTLRTNIVVKDCKEQCKDKQSQKSDDIQPSTKVRGSGTAEDGSDSGTLDRTKKEVMESARRLNRIVDMQSALEEFTLRLMARTLSVSVEEDKKGDAQ